jgi:hypothetical protein
MVIISLLHNSLAVRGRQENIYTKKIVFSSGFFFTILMGTCSFPLQEETRLKNIKKQKKQWSNFLLPIPQNMHHNTELGSGHN